MKKLVDTLRNIAIYLFFMTFGAALIQISSSFHESNSDLTLSGSLFSISDVKKNNCPHKKTDYEKIEFILGRIERI